MAFDLDEDELEATRKLNGVGSIEKDEFKNLKEIIELCRHEIDEGNENVNATLDYEDLKELFYLLESYQQEKEKVQEYEKQLDLDYVDKNYVSKEYHEMVVKEQNDIIEDLKEKNKKLEEDKQILEIMKNENEKEIGILIDKVNARGEVIDMFVENIVEYHVPYDYCIAYGKNPDECDVLDNNEKCKECIKEYYFKKVRGEK